MILTTLRIMESGDFSQRQECAEVDFERVLYTRSGYLELGKSLSIPDKTADRYITCSAMND